MNALGCKGTWDTLRWLLSLSYSLVLYWARAIHSLCSSLARPVCSWPWIRTAHSSLEGNLFHLSSVCLLNRIYAKKNTLYRGQLWKRPLVVSQSGLTFPWVWRSNRKGKMSDLLIEAIWHILSHLNTHKKPCKGGNMLQEAGTQKNEVNCEVATP